VAADYGEDMLATFAERSADVRRRGRAHHAAFLARELGDLVRVVLIERVRARRELYHASRRLAHAPAFTGVATLTLALAIGATSAVFTLVHRIVLADLPYPAADRLIALDHTAPSIGLQSGIGMSIGTYREYAKLPSIQSIAIYDVTEGTITGADAAERIQYLFTTPTLGGILNIQPAIGRWFTAEDGVARAPDVVVLGDGLWRRAFNGSADAIGKTIQFNGRAHEVVGVLPPDFAFPDPTPQLVVPLALPHQWDRAAGFNYRGIARLARGVTLEEARREQNLVIRDLPRRYPSDPEVRTGIIASGQLASYSVPYKQYVLGSASTALWAVLGAAAIMLALACANLANLFLVRTDARHDEVALRRALGAGSSDIVAYFLAESLLVALVGGIIGLAISQIAIGAIVGRVAGSLPRVHEVRIDGTVVAFTAAASVIVGLTLGLVCIARHGATRRSSLVGVERSGTANRGHMRSRYALMAAQIALAVVLLAGAGLVLRSFYHVSRVELGFKVDSALVFRVGLPRGAYRGGAAIAFHHEAMHRIAAIPGVEGVALTSTLPLDGPGLGNPLEVFGSPNRSVDASPVARFRRVSESYFTTMGMRLNAGRPLSDRGVREVIVNEALAALYFPTENPVGRQVRAMGEAGQDWLTIIGVVSNTVVNGLSETTPTPQIYVSLGDSARGNLPAPQDVTYIVRVSGDPAGWGTTVRSTFSTLDPRVPLWKLETFTDVVARARATLSFTLVLLGIAASIALVLGILGVYGVISYSVRQRGMEIGVRIALGATPSRVTRMIVGQSGVAIALGVFTGVGASLVSARLLRSLLHGVSPTDAATHAATSALLLLVAMVACWLPARAAARLDPLAALRRG
jgi:predicted permease